MVEPFVGDVFDWVLWFASACGGTVEWIFTYRALLLGMVVGAFVWEVTSPVRRLVGFVVGKVYRKADHWAFLLWQCVERYQSRVSSAEVAALCASESLWVRFVTLFLVPSGVLRKHCGDAEGLGKVCLKWLDAHCYYSWCVLVPTTTREALESLVNFWNGVPTAPAETSACLTDLLWEF
ncbi:hypothetical protein BBJ28_00026747 [Nothophytophthora sp. Chile5]|nr:hypothetical protein BBJ28_00026747 [Nothophytophthora sp. Chile5]